MGQRGGFDGAGHVTIGGRPRFVLGVYDSGGGYSTDRAQWERQVFADRQLDGVPINVYLNYYLGGMPIDATMALLDVLHAHGISYLQTGNSFESGAWQRMPFSISSEQYVRAFAEHPAALGYYVFDEPYDELIPETVQHHRQLKAWDPDGITFGALMAGWPSGSPTRTNPAMWVDAADILAVDPYPVSKQADGPPPQYYPHFVVPEHVSKLRAAVPASRPIWAVLQLFVGMGGARLPTFDEMRYHAIASIVEGAQGLMWWGIGSTQLRQDTDPATVATYTSYLRDLVSELAVLEPALVSGLNSDTLFRGLPLNSTTYPDPIAGRIEQLRYNIAADWLYSRKEMYQEEIAALQVGDTSKSGGMLNGCANVRTRASVANGQGVVLAYNYTNLPQAATLTVPGIESYHVKVWENRAPDRLYDVVNGIAWSDTFAPYEAKIYVIGQ